MEFDKQYVLDFTKDILLTDSPSGFTYRAMGKIGEYAQALGYDFSISNKGCGIINSHNGSERTLALSAHVDTLGLMVRSIKTDGTLAVTRIGAPIIPTLDGEYCKIYTRGGKHFTGTILSDSPTAHVYEDASEKKRSLETIHVRLDEIVKGKDDVIKLGVSAGDFICIDPKTEITETGFIKSRFLDDKLSLGAIFGVLKYLRDNDIALKENLLVLISSHEEVGHGMAWIPGGIDRLIAVDMGCVGADLSGGEYGVSICAKDASGPYDYELTDTLVRLAQVNGLTYAVDIYPYYSSDVSAALKAGHDIKGALVGPGVAASHGMERSHYMAVENTMKLLAAYLVL